MTCKRCGLPPTSPVRESGDTRWPATMRGYCLDCTSAIVGEWESNKAIVSRPAGIIYTPDPLTAETADRIRAEWEMAYTGKAMPRLEIKTKERRGFWAWLRSFING